MRLGKSLIVLAVLVLAFSPSISQAQPPVSLEDSIWIEPQITSMPANVDTTFSIRVLINNAKTLGAISIPIVYPGPPELNVDSSVVSGGNKGVTYGPAGNDAGWTLKTSFIDPVAQGTLLGFISFGQFNPTNDTLVYLHFKLDAQVGNHMVFLDSGAVNNQHIGITDVLAAEFIPTWNHTNAKIEIGVVGIGDGPAVKPNDFALNQNFPNPFNADTKISFALPRADHVKLRVFNVLGQEVVTLVDRKLDANQHDIIWDGMNGQGTLVASGTYFYRLEIGDSFEKTLQMTLLK